jgi:hypothetical protein
MKKLFIFMMVILPVMVFAQPNPSHYHIIFGNRDGSPMVVQLGTLIQVPVWGATSPGPADFDDTVSFMNIPLASDRRYIESRNGAICNPNCDTFSDPEFFGPENQYICQTLLRFGYLHDPPWDPACFLCTHGDTVLISTFLMTTTSDTTCLGRTVCPFFSCSNGILWGMSDGANGVVPIQAYGCLHFELCQFTPGDANGDSVFNGLDIVFCIEYFKGRTSPSMYTCNCGQFINLRVAADINGDCRFSGIDVTYGVNYLKGRGTAPTRCLSCL